MADLDITGTETAALVASYRTIDRRIREWEAVREDIKRRIQAGLGDSEVGVIEGKPVVRWTSVVSNRLDTKLLRKKFPEDDLADCYTITATRRFTLVEPTPEVTP